MANIEFISIVNLSSKEEFYHFYFCVDSKMSLRSIIYLTIAYRSPCDPQMSSTFCQHKWFLMESIIHNGQICILVNVVQLRSHASCHTLYCVVIERAHFGAMIYPFRTCFAKSTLLILWFLYVIKKQLLITQH